MKKILFSIILLYASVLNAQRIGGDASASLLGGIVKNGYQGQFQVDYYLPYTYLVLQGRLMYSNQNLPTIYDSKMNLQQFGFSALIGWSPEEWLKHPFFFNVLVGGYVGYDYGNNGKDIFSPYEIPFDSKLYNRVTYGFITSVQGEINLSQKVSIMSDFSQVYRFKSEFGKSTYYGSIGLKYYF